MPRLHPGRSKRLRHSPLWRLASTLLAALLRLAVLLLLLTCQLLVLMRCRTFDGCKAQCGLHSRLPGSQVGLTGWTPGRLPILLLLLLLPPPLLLLKVPASAVPADASQTFASWHAGGATAPQ